MQLNKVLNSATRDWFDSFDEDWSGIVDLPAFCRGDDCRSFPVQGHFNPCGDGIGCEGGVSCFGEGAGDCTATQKRGWNERDRYSFLDDEENQPAFLSIECSPDRLHFFHNEFWASAQ